LNKHIHKNIQYSGRGQVSGARPTAGKCPVTLRDRFTASRPDDIVRDDGGAGDDRQRVAASGDGRQQLLLSWRRRRRK